MFLTVHATIGAVIGQHLPQPWIAFVLGFLSHFFVDLIPHGDQGLASGKTHEERVRKLLIAVAIDGAVLACVGATVALHIPLDYPSSAIAGAFGAMLPDGLQGIAILSREKFLRRFRYFHERFHLVAHERWSHIVVPFSIGLPLQIATLLFFLRLLGT